MSRMSDMAQTIEDLRSAAAAISDAADWLTKMFSGEPQAEDAPASPPEPELTLEQVRTVLADKSRQGHTAEIRALLQKYGASKLSQIDPAHYKACGLFLCHLGGGVYAKTEEIQAYQVHGEDLAL